MRWVTGPGGAPTRKWHPGLRQFGDIGRVPLTLNPFSLAVSGIQIPGLPPGTQLSDLLNLPIHLGANERGASVEQLTHGGTIDCDTDHVPLGP